MMYESAKWIDIYGEHVGILATINGIPLSVPLDPANTDYANLMELEREGKIVIQPADGEQQ